MEGEYRKLHIRSSAPKSLRESTEGKYWRRFAAPTTIQQIGIVSHIHYSPVAPHDYAVTSSTRVLIYDGRTHALKKTVARFPDTAYCGTFRSDGLLLAAGCESGAVQVFDLASRAVLRQFRTHARPTHGAAFSPDKTHLASASDDTTVRLWDLAQGEQVVRLDGHTDYARCVRPASDDVWLSGSYDHTVRVWDARQRDAAMTLEHGAPVEGVDVFLGGRLAAAAGGTCVALWDLAAGGRALARMTNHQKTVTSVRAVDVRGRDGGASVRLLSSALDGHVKVYSLDSFKVVYAYKYPAPVLSAAVGDDLNSMAVGMADRTLVVRKHRKPRGVIEGAGVGAARKPKRERAYAPRLTASSYKYFVRGMNVKATENDVVVQARRRATLKPYDKLLKAFRYGEALDEVLETGQIDIVLSLVEELAARQGLVTALRNRPESSIARLLAQLNKYAAHPEHARCVVQTVETVLELHADAIARSEALTSLLLDLKSRIAAEAKLQEQLQMMHGAMEMML